MVYETKETKGAKLGRISRVYGVKKFYETHLRPVFKGTALHCGLKLKVSFSLCVSSNTSYNGAHDQLYHQKRM